MNAPFGILPASIGVLRNGEIGESKEYAAKVVVEGPQGYEFNGTEAYKYMVDNSLNKRDEVYTIGTNRLISREHNRVMARLVNVYPINHGIETTYYDVSVPYEKPFEAYDGNGQLTRKWLSVAGIT